MTATAIIGLNESAGAVVSVRGSCTHCIFFEFSLDHPPFIVENITRVAMCPIDKVAEMAAARVTVWQFLRAKFRRWFNV